MKKIKPFYLQNRFFYACIGLIILFVFSFVFPWLFTAVSLLLVLLVALTVLDIIVLFSTKKGLEASRILPEKLSNGDENDIQI